MRHTYVYTHTDFPYFVWKCDLVVFFFFFFSLLVLFAPVTICRSTFTPHFKWLHKCDLHLQSIHLPRICAIVLKRPNLGIYVTSSSLLLRICWQKYIQHIYFIYVNLFHWCMVSMSTGGWYCLL